MDTQTFEIVLNVINAICLLFCFSKMGIEPIAAIIPFYGTWCLYDRVWGRGLLVLIISLILAVFIPLGSTIISMATYWRMFRGFGKGPVFCLFGIIFQPIAIAICAFDGSSYCG